MPPRSVQQGIQRTVGLTSAIGYKIGNEQRALFGEVRLDDQK